jgi:hypothetical protein
MLQNIIPFGLWGGSVCHDAHHVHGDVHYQKFFTYIDTLLDTTVAARSEDKHAAIQSKKPTVRDQPEGSVLCSSSSCQDVEKEL